MNRSVEQQVSELRQMSVAQLREQHLELFGEPNNSGHREYLFRRIAWRLQAEAEGGLEERMRRIRKRAKELARDADVRTTAPKPIAAAQPGPDQVVRSETLSVGDDRLPMPGAVITRKFKGRTYRVTVHPVGFEMDGEHYKSLSAVAKAITGSHWNGYLFFGLKSPRNRKPRQSTDAQEQQ